MIRGLFQVAISTVVRLGAGIFTFIYAASAWTAADFGSFMFAFSLSAMLVLCCEFGFSQQVLKEVGENPQSISHTFSRFFATKLCLAAVLIAVSFAFGFFILKYRQEQTSQFLLLLLAAIFTSFSDLVLSALRALRMYGDEVRISISTTLIAVLIFFGLIFLGGSPMQLAIAFMVVRFIQMVVFFKVFSTDWISVRGIYENCSIGNLLQTLKTGSAYASDVFVGAALVNLDMILVTRLLGYAEAGVYQAAARLSQGVGIVYSVLASYFLPRLSAEAIKQNPNAGLTAQFGMVTAILGLLLVAGFVGAMFFYDSMPDDSPLDLSAKLLPGFAVLVIPRLLSGFFGVILTAQGKQSSRAMLYALALMVFVASAFFLIEVYGVWGVIFAYGIAYGVLSIGFAIVSRKSFSLACLYLTAAAVLISGFAIALIFRSYS
ncbi:MAG: oligosaccharide flippase family protein [Methyloversatilis sp.]|uniref:lipopolysaccharide biosynthesis protein n=1 Tax=Methyloversatilis sp. TaxID=2569862 RepID=UPI00273267B6|nr:oligosaccharide flippase family protein [Methyloversatilis sp.]MDP3873732.1 oligosaccharide flippase family protein [Methyloversatilis sp.]